MKIYKNLTLTISTLLLFNLSYSQNGGPYYTGASRCIFLKSEDSLLCDLIYSYDFPANYLKSVQGFSLDNNSIRDSSFKYINIEIRRVNKYLRLSLKKNARYKLPEDSVMIIKLKFLQIPDTVNYYLFINEFKPGTTKSVTIPAKLIKMVAVDICCKIDEKATKLRLSRKQPYKLEYFKTVPSYDITGIVFPSTEMKNEK